MKAAVSMPLMSHMVRASLHKPIRTISIRPMYEGTVHPAGLAGPTATAQAELERPLTLG